MDIIISDDEIKKYQERNNNVSPIRSVDEHVNALSVVTLDQFMSLDIKPLEYVVFPIMTKPGIGMICAKTGIGKTLFALSLAYAMAGGDSFLKCKCPESIKVLYVDGEMQSSLLKERFKLLTKQQGNLQEPSNFMLLSRDRCPNIPRIDDSLGQEVYRGLIEEHGIKAIFFDNLSSLSSHDENSPTEWAPIQDWFLSLRAMGVTVFFVHHAGKGNIDYRGTSKMGDCLDVLISLKPIDNDYQDENHVPVTRFMVHYRKHRAPLKVDVHPYEAILQNDAWICRSYVDAMMAKVIECWKASMNQTATANELGITQPHVSRLLQKARDLHLIQK